MLDALASLPCSLRSFLVEKGLRVDTAGLTSQRRYKLHSIYFKHKRVMPSKFLSIPNTTHLSSAFQDIQLSFQDG